MAKKNNSDATGRAFEYVIVEEIINNAKACTALKNTNADQSRDKVKHSSLDPALQASFLTYGKKIFQWLDSNWRITSLPFTLERLPDSAAKKGDVTDIRIIVNGTTLNLSIKLNHEAVKHQRPPATVIRCGYAKKGIEDATYRADLNNIFTTFLNGAKLFVPGVTLFNDLKVQDPNYINDNLYLPVCQLVADTLNNICKNPINVQAYFTFLIGNTNFYKLIARGGSVTIHEFNNIAIPSTLKARVVDKSYVEVVFSNGWVISMRLHTASSRIGTSTKFDSRLGMNIKSVVPTIII